ncbi:MAG TPA: hypothetical protein VJZ00_04285 [Thermoanaerobaculia bacterium]|nr:hypothetical protein [Thermoanaerobaculia bacterium]
MEETNQLCPSCRAGTPMEGTRVCPECGHSFAGLGWEGIDAHWRAKHESIMHYEDFWLRLCRGHRSGNRPRVATTEGDLSREARALARFVAGKTVKQIWRDRPGELGIEFTDGTRLFVDHVASGLELSVN